ncbi:MAG: ribulose-phosphate 3-epimerase [Clostridia bacterium]|nr:ribulose-phosphate 3-epimerase [Clostridia bacterium]
MRKTMVAPSILSADFAKMGEEIQKLTQMGADMIHCDVMDGIFVPNITFGIKMIADIRPHTRLPLDVHLMIDRPERYVEQFAAAGADYITVHVEATDNVTEALTKIRALGKKSGVVIKPNTPVDAVLPYLDLVDMILVMSVEPGFGGQAFLPSAVDKLSALRKLIDEKNLHILLEVDGGINASTLPVAVAAGAEVIVAGNYVFKAEDPAAVIQNIKNA